ncbi:MAG TPA: hypothetical protein VE465_10825 [Streptosporangiaceae bacterium]|nr:hypothetical protein [Streptosporangiaceae bacterium]
MADLNRRVRAGAAALIVMAGALAGCGGAGAPAAVCADPVPVDRERLAALPAGLDLRRTGTVTEVTKGDGGFVSATAVADSTVDETYTTFPEVLAKAGFEVVAAENEGVEADIFFARDQAATGSVKLTEGPCEGQVTARLTVTNTGG